MSAGPVRKVFAGPLREGQEVRVTLAPKQRTYRLVGRLLDGDGDPIERKRLLAAFETDTGWSGRKSFTTDAAGQFKLALGGPGQAVTLTILSIKFDSPASFGRPQGQPGAIYIMPRSIPLALGSNDLGDLVLGEGPLFASGRILIDGQAPQREQFGLQVESLRVQRGSARTGEFWNPEQSLTLEVLADGRFEIRGEPRATRHRIGLSMLSSPARGGRLEFLPFEPLEFARGSPDLLLELHSGGSLQATVLIVGPIPARDLWLRMVPEDGGDRKEYLDPRYQLPPPWGMRQYTQYRKRQEDRLTYHWRALWPGTYDLEILPRGASVPVLTIPDIEITAGARNKDPRLDPIDLRDKLRKIEIVLEDGEGHRLLQHGCNCCVKGIWIQSV